MYSVISRLLRSSSNSKNDLYTTILSNTLEDQILALSHFLGYYPPRSHNPLHSPYPHRLPLARILQLQPQLANKDFILWILFPHLVALGKIWISKEKMKNSILLTGGSGFPGSHLTAGLSPQGIVNLFQHTLNIRQAPRSY